MVRPQDEPITSPENPQLRLARSLLEPAGRRRQRAFLVEGLRLVEAAAAAVTPRLVLYAPPFGQRDARERRLLLGLSRAGCPLRAVAGALLAQATDTVTPQGIVAVVPLPDGAPPEAWGDQEGGPGGDRSPLVLVLDAVGDPGNAGTLLRSAVGAGATAVLATKGTVDLYAPKVVRAGAGAHFLMDVAAGLDREGVAGRLPPGCQVLLADQRAATPYWEADWTRPTAVVLSSEAHGVDATTAALAGQRVAIPSRGVESLNVAVAGSVLLFEAVRQRAVSPPPPARGAGARRARVGAGTRQSRIGKGRVAR
jgi:TrmH family RNA methyltransferase